MKRLVFIPLLLYCLGSYAQINRDSIWQIWGNTTLPDEDRLLALHVLSDEYYLESERDSAKMLGQWQLALSQEKGLKTSEANALEDLGRMLQSIGEYDSATVLLHESLSIRQSLGEEKAMARSLFFLGESSWQQGLYDSALVYLRQCLQLAERHDDLQIAGRAHNHLGIIHWFQGNIKEAMAEATLALSLGQQCNDIRGEAYAYLGIGNIYQSMSNYPRAMVAYEKSYILQNRLENAMGIASALINLGVVSENLGQYDRALSYYEESLGIMERLGNLRGMGHSLVNMGVICENLEDYDLAKQYYKESLLMWQTIEDKRGVARALRHLAGTYLKQGDYAEARSLVAQSLALERSIPHVVGETSCLQLMGQIYQAEGQLDLAQVSVEEALFIADSLNLQRFSLDALILLAQVSDDQDRKQLALRYAKRANDMARVIGHMEAKRDAEQVLANIHKTLGNYQPALLAYERYVIYRDSLENQELQKELIRQQYEQQAELDSLKAAEALRLSEARLATAQANRRLQTFYLIAGLIVALLVGVGLIQRNRIAQQQRNRLEHAYDELSAKNTEILDSIAYARHLQGAILPKEAVLHETFNQSFVYYQPKAIVAGDFYWLEKLGETTLWAVADCTGHGVPGALISIVCHQGLKNAVQVHGQVLPGKILDLARTTLQQDLGDQEEDINDGMDVGLCTLEGDQLHYAGAYRPLWIVRKGTQQLTNLQENYPAYRISAIGDHTVIEIKGDRQPIGKFLSSAPFTSYCFQVQKGDALYLFTDGLTDQFGGPQNKKFRAGPLKQLLVEMYELPMKDQKDKLTATLAAWQGEEEQVDDMCMLGVRV